MIRVDAGPVIGTGHVYRCMALAEELAGRGWVSTFASRDIPTSLRELIYRAGHQLLELPSGLDIEDEPQFIADQLQAGRVDAALTDHYNIRGPWHHEARRWAGTVAAIDDLARDEQDVDLIVNQNLGTAPDTYDGLIPPTAMRLMGPKFALLRPQFADARGESPRVRTRVDRLLVFIGGGDQPNVIDTILTAVGQVGIPADFVVGAAYPHIESLELRSARYSSVRLHQNSDEMAALMMNADLSVGAPSSASWERCCVGLPTILVTVAENQRQAGRALVGRGAAVDLGWYTDVDVSQIERAVATLAEDPAKLAEMSRAAASVTDGRGACRVSSALESLI